MKKFLLALVLCFAPLFVLADAGDVRTVEMWNCTLKDGKKMEDIQANNVKWLAMVRKATGSDSIRSYAMTTVVGDLKAFMFVDTYPDLATWSKAKSAAQTPEGQAIDATFNELSECTENRLFKSTEH